MWLVPRKATAGSTISRLRAPRPCEVGMHETPRARLVAYGVAVLAVAVTLLVRSLLWGGLGGAVPTMAFFPAVVVAAYYGGLGPPALTPLFSPLSSTFAFPWP